MRCDNTNNLPKINNLLLYTVAGTLAVPLIASLVVPAIYLPILALTLPFLAAAYAEHKAEALGCSA
jgi:hypothetical protein